MKICPRCNREYEENLENCLVCGAELTEYTPILSAEERDALELNGEVTADMLEEINPENLPEIICSVVGKEEAVRLSALMQEYRIPCMCKENGEEEGEDTPRVLFSGNRPTVAPSFRAEEPTSSAFVEKQAPKKEEFKVDEIDKGYAKMKVPTVEILDDQEEEDIPSPRIEPKEKGLPAFLRKLKR